MSASTIRRHDGASKPLFLFETLCVLTAYGLVGWLGLRISQHISHWDVSCCLAIFLGWIVADFVSGCVHWLADTWGSESMPWIGPRFLKPFRVHHVTPTSFVECSFMDTNGDTALIGIPFLMSVFWVPIDTPIGFWITVLMVSFCICALPTNQIHQWAHMPNPPRAVQWLQRIGVILSIDAHRRHHAGDHDGHYCITTGFCNRLLERMGFFRWLERGVTRMTGIEPRAEEKRGHCDGTETTLS